VARLLEEACFQLREGNALQEYHLLLLLHLQKVLLRVQRRGIVVYLRLIDPP
jgi:hypothetical protein